MPNVIRNNAYRILGLDGSANQKDILKRYKEIINRLKIDDYPKYNLDVNLPDKFRTEESVNDALKRLQNTKNNLIEYFFWFHIADTIDENAIISLQYNDATSHNQAIVIWKNASETENSIGLFYKKNLAILYCLTLLNKENDVYLKESLSNWHEIINSDKFWVSFEKDYNMINDQTANVEIITEFRKNVAKYISDIYTDLYQQYEDPKYVKDFQEIFGIHGEQTEKNLLKPIHQSIYDTIAELNKITQEENIEKIKKSDNKCDNCGDASANKYFDYDDGSVLCETCRKNIGKEWKEKVDNLDETIEGSKMLLNSVQKIIAKLESQLAQLRETGLYEDSQSKVVRDHIAEAIRDASVHIHNKALMSKQSADLLNLAIQIAGTESIKERYKSDLNEIHKIATDDEKTALILPIPKFLGKKDLIVKNNFMEYKNKKIYYRDVVEISYHNEEAKFHFVIRTNDDKIDLTFSNQQDLWYELINIAKQYIEPVIVAKLVKLIFEENIIIQIGKIAISKNGFHKSKLLRGIDSVLWSDENIYNPKLIQGTVNLYKDHNNFSQYFASIPLEQSNAAILPELINACYREFLMRHPRN